jgi:hypothetical protein
MFWLSNFHDVHLPIDPFSRPSEMATLMPYLLMSMHPPVDVTIFISSPAHLQDDSNLVMAIKSPSNHRQAKEFLRTKSTMVHLNLR